MKPMNIQFASVLAAICVLAVGVYLIRKSFSSPEETTSTSARIPIETRVPAALDIGADEGGRAGTYQAEMLTDFPTEVRPKKDPEVEWSQEECLKFTAHMKGLGAGDFSAGAGGAVDGVEAWCKSRDVAPSFMRCALSKSSSAELVECAGVGVDEYTDDEDDLGESWAE